MASETGKIESSPKHVITPSSSPTRNYFTVDLSLRLFLFATSLVAVLVMVTANQTKQIPVPGLPFTVPLPAKFNYSPALIYFVAALSVTCLYSIITALASLVVISKPSYSKLVLLFFALSDVIVLGLVASATGTAGGVAYIGLKGNKHSRWGKICNVYDKFCRHQGSSIGVSLVAAIILVLLSMLSSISLYKRIP